MGVAAACGSCVEALVALEEPWARRALQQLRAPQRCAAIAVGSLEQQGVSPAVARSYARALGLWLLGPSSEEGDSTGTRQADTGEEGGWLLGGRDLGADSIRRLVEVECLGDSRLAEALSQAVSLSLEGEETETQAGVTTALVAALGRMAETHRGEAGAARETSRALAALATVTEAVPSLVASGAPGLMIRLAAPWTHPALERREGRIDVTDGVGGAAVLGHIGAVLANLSLTLQGREAVCEALGFPLMIALAQSEGEGSEAVVLAGLAGIANASEAGGLYALQFLEKGALHPVCRYGGGCGGGQEDAAIADFACAALGHLLQAGAGPQLATLAEGEKGSILGILSIYGNN